MRGKTEQFPVLFLSYTATGALALTDGKIVLLLKRVQKNSAKGKSLL
jgi:hypothetical protein